MGRDKGFRCRSCRYRFAQNKIIVEESRSISLGTYQTRKYRHLTKPVFMTE
ncbi:hypothetical protein [Metallosphaera hakonensis]|uniref:hypothetical protein n=1 Tax=Metallosphaera hakonensis TaxID=79601 RepID=UPI00402B3707